MAKNTQKNQKLAPTVLPSTMAAAFGVELQAVPLALGLDVDHTYHRGLRPRRMNKIAALLKEENYTPYATIVERAGGGYVIVDGVNVVNAVEANGYEHVLARVLPPMSYEEEVALYLRSNRSMSAADKHRANLARGEVIAVEIEKVLKKHKLRADTGHAKSGSAVRAIGTLRTAWGSHANYEDTSVLTKQEIATGRQALDYAVRSLLDFVKRGDKAYDVYTQMNLSAMIQIALKADKNKLPSSAVQLAKYFANESAVTMRNKLTDGERSATQRRADAVAKILNDASATGDIVDFGKKD